MTRLIDADSIPWDVDGVGEIPVITKEEINAMPTVEAVPVRHGEWMPLPYDSGGYWKCSNCETPTEASGANVLYKYCPFCGAKMDKRKEE